MYIVLLVNAALSICCQITVKILHTLPPLSGSSSPLAGCASSRTPSWVYQQFASQLRVEMNASPLRTEERITVWGGWPYTHSAQTDLNLQRLLHSLWENFTRRRRSSYRNPKSGSVWLHIGLLRLRGVAAILTERVGLALALPDHPPHALTFIVFLSDGRIFLTFLYKCNVEDTISNSVLSVGGQDVSCKNKCTILM